MTLSPQPSAYLTEIPYQESASHYMEHLLHLPGCILFDSGRPLAERGRYDILSAAPLYSLRYTEGLLTQTGRDPQILTGLELTATLNRLLEQHQQANAAFLEDDKRSKEPKLPFQGGFAGYFSYDLARCWEQLPEHAVRDIDIPELMLGFYSWSCVLDHQLKKAWLSFLPECPQGLREQIQHLLKAGHTRTDRNNFKIISKLNNKINVNYYQKNIGKIQEYILNGDCYQVNYAQRFEGHYQGHPWHAYQALRSSMAAPYGVYFQFKSTEFGEDNVILSYSPERFLQVSNKSILTQPIKGTIKRHPDSVQDRENAGKLLASEKNRAENLMIVDLLRNDLGKCCEYGSVKTEKLFELQTVSNVHHLVSSVVGLLQSQLTPFDLLQATLPGGSITGAPKLRSMEIIEELEPSRRAIYCGVLGYINIDGNMDSNIAIRTVLCESQTGNEGKVYVWGGGGIVADSEWRQEYEESLVKVERLLKGLEALS